jgi:hypothetical protein
MADLLTNLAAAAGAAGDAEIEPLGVDYDGSADYLSRATDLTGNSDGKTFTFSAWLYPTVQPSSGFFFDIADPVGGVPNPKRFYMRTASNDLFITVATSPYETIVLSATISASLPNDTFSNVLVSCDMANVANRYVYINDVAASVTWTTYANLNIPFTGGAGGVGFGIGATASGGANYKGRISGLYLDYTYRDLSIEANRRLFIDDDGLYVTPPTTGIISVPMDDPADPGRNDGTGGNFTLNGVVARSGRGPNEYNAAASTFVKTLDYLSIASLSGVSDSKNFTFAVLFKAPTSESPDLIHIGDVSAVRFQIQPNTSNGNVAIIARNSGGTTILSATVQAAIIANAYNSLVVSIGLASTLTRSVLVNGVAASVIYGTYTDDTIDFTYGITYVGFNTIATAGNFSGQASDIYFDTTYIDLSADNPFYDTDTDKPKFLGATGNLPTGSAPLIYLPLYASSAGTNLGTGGDFTVNSGPYVGARGPSEFWADSAEFNGTNQSLTRTSALTGAVDGKAFSLAIAYKADTTSGYHPMFKIASDNASASNWALNISQSGTSIIIEAFNSSGTRILDDTLGSFVPDTNWHTALITVDLTSSSLFEAFLDMVDQNPSASTYTNSDITFSDSDIRIGQERTNYFDGRIGFLWFNTSYIDFSQEANRLKFFDAFNNPVDLGADGSVPTGSQPLIYMNEGFHLGTNLGSGGNFTPSGTPTDGGYVNG